MTEQQDRLTTLYEWSEAMSAAGDSVKEKHEKDYKEIIEYAKTSANSKERIMAAQLVARFFKFFPDLQEQAFDSIVDLCESADVDVRKHATMAMITICRGSAQMVSKAADILIQLYQTKQPSEVNLINQSLTTLLNLNIEQFLKSFFANFDEGSEIVRERSLKFLVSKIHNVAESSLTKEIEEQLMNYTKKAMEDVTKEEFIAFIGILSKLKIAKTSSGQAAIAAAIKSQAEMGKEFDVNDKDFLDRFLLCTQHTIPFLSQYNRASEYVNYICLKILPHLSELAASGQDLNVLQTLAEMSPYVSLDDSPQEIDFDKCHKTVYDKLLEYLPEPSSAAQEADFQFTHIECLMYTFIQLSRLKPEATQLDAASTKRLSHLSNGCKKYTDALERQLQNKDLNQEENKLRTIALSTTKNISTMILGLFKKPVALRAKRPGSLPADVGGLKRRRVGA